MRGFLLSLLFSLYRWGGGSEKPRNGLRHNSQKVEQLPSCLRLSHILFSGGEKACVTHIRMRWDSKFSKKEVLRHATTWMNLGDIMPWETR